MQGKPLTVREAADALNLSQPTIRAWLARRRISVIRLGRAIRVPAAEIDRLLAEGLIPREECRSSAREAR